MCKYSIVGYSCNRNEEHKEGFCIFHCDKEKFKPEQIKEFKDEFWEEFKRQEKV